MMRYQLLLKEYQKHLTATDPDWQDTENALTSVLDAASHANEMVGEANKIDNHFLILADAQAGPLPECVGGAGAVGQHNCVGVTR